MPTPTYDLIASTTLAASTSSVVFGSLPSTYRDLILVVEGSGSGSDSALITFNGDTGANYTYVRMFGTGSGSGTSSNGTSREIMNIYTGRGTHVVQIMDYSATDKHTTSLSRSSTAGTIVMAFANRWANTAAVTSITLSLGSTTFSATTTFNLYGVIS